MAQITANLTHISQHQLTIGYAARTNSALASFRSRAHYPPAGQTSYLSRTGDAWLACSAVIEDGEMAQNESFS